MTEQKHYVIRTAVRADEKKICDLFEEMLRTIYRTDLVKGYENGVPDKYWRGGEDRIYVAEAREIVAFLSVEVYREPEEYMYLDDLSVTAACRDRGIGTTLLRTAEAYARERGLPAILLHVEKTNIGARRLYNRMGYQTFRDDGSRILMRKDLRAGTADGGQ